MYVVHKDMIRCVYYIGVAIQYLKNPCVKDLFEWIMSKKQA
jgi:hypothetical protein